MAENSIQKVKIIRGVPKHVYNLDRKRFEKDYKTIKGLKKAKRLSGERKGYNA
tara:strand:- start:260 stop:418 length:159 start_codon:yes stop_codon:yes gene_type:complete